METCKDLPELKLNVKEDENDVFRLLEEIKTDWKREDITVKRLSGGNSCSMLRCCHTSGESITVRVRNNFDGLKEPMHERQVIKVMSAKGYFAPLLAVFQNGYCYEYVPGHSLVSMDSKEMDITQNQIRLIAEQLASIHAVVVPELDYNETSLFCTFYELIASAKPWFEGCPSKDELKEELRIVEELVPIANSPLVLCHGDAHPANFIWDEGQGKLTFVDWEGARIAPRAYDIAYFFNAVDNFGNFLQVPVAKSSVFERKFCYFYLQRWNKLHTKVLPTEEEMEQLLLELKYYLLVVKLAHVIFVVRFKEIITKIGSVDRIWQFTFNKYLSAKEDLLGIKKLGLSPE